MKRKDNQGMAELEPRQNEAGLPSDMEALLKGLDSLKGDLDDPDRPFGEQSKEVLKALVSMMDEMESEFAEKSVVIDRDVFAHFREAARLLKRVSEEGGRVVKIDMEPHAAPASIRFVTDDVLTLSGEALEAFGDLVETADCMEMETNLDGEVEFDFSFRHMWKSIGEDLESD